MLEAFLGMARRMLFIVNPAAGAARRWHAFAAALNRQKTPPKHIFTKEPGEASRLAQNFAGEYDALIAVGGDGTVSEVSNGILLSGAAHCTLGILPTGTGNDAASELGIQTENDALGALAAERTRSIDMIEVRCQVRQKPALQYALLFAGVGLVCESLKKTTRMVKRLFGRRLCYPIGVLLALCSYHAPRMRITFEGRTLERRFLFVGISNTERAGGGMRIAPDAKLDDGVLHLNLIDDVGRLEALTQLRALCRGRHIHQPYVQYLPGQWLTVDAQTPLEVAADGELLGWTPASFSIKPKAIQVLVPCKTKVSSDFIT